MDLHHLRIFYEVAEEGSFTKAAKKLYINQSAVSIQVKKFEEHLNLKLFDRETKKIKLTYAGEVLYKKAKVIFQEVENAKEEIEKVVSGEKAKIIIGATHMIGEPLLPEIISGFSKKYSEIEYEIYIQERDILLERLKNGEIDLLLMGEYFIKDKNYDIIPIQEYPFVAVYNKKIKNINEIEKIPLIARNDSLLLFKNLSYLEKKYNLNFSKQIIVNGSIEIIKNLVIEGVGFTILPYYCVYKEIKNKEMRIIFDYKDKKNSNGYQIVKISNKYQKKEINKFIEFVQKFNINVNLDK